jgi:hypothetical protein
MLPQHGADLHARAGLEVLILAREAVRLAERARDLRSEPVAVLYSTLAAASAAVGVPRSRISTMIDALPTVRASASRQ